MKVLMINGSPRPQGNTALALGELERTFADLGIESETVQVGQQAVRGCIACGRCGELGRSGPPVLQHPFRQDHEGGGQCGLRPPGWLLGHL